MVDDCVIAALDPSGLLVGGVGLRVCVVVLAGREITEDDDDEDWGDWGDCWVPLYDVS